MSYKNKISAKLPITFFWGKDSNNKPAHFFIKCREDKLKLMESQPEISPLKYGEIIASGFDHLPSQATIDTLKKEHDYNFIVPDELSQQFHTNYTNK